MEEEEEEEEEDKKEDAKWLGLRELSPERTRVRAEGTREGADAHARYCAQHSQTLASESSG